MFETALNNFLSNWHLLLLIPVVSGVIGYVTNIMALNMMFQPLNFIGIPPYLGWQGIVPRRAKVMAEIAVDTITGKLITPHEMVSRLDPERIAAQLEKPLKLLVDEMMESIAEQEYPQIWRTLPDSMKARIRERLHAQVPSMVEDLTKRLQENAEEVLDIKHMVVTHLQENKELLNRIFLEVGKPEFTFIARSGAYFGFMLGIAQMVCYTFYPADWLLPVFGLAIGYLTNWVALKIIFEPKEPVRVGFIKIQGLFLKRQEEVAVHYAQLVSREILTIRNLLTATLTGPGSTKLYELVAEEVTDVVNDGIGIVGSVALNATGQLQAVRERAVEHAIEHTPALVEKVKFYAEGALAVEETLVDRLSKLSPTDFEGLLRPAFEQDEWMLITAGAVLGLLAGFAQLVFVFT